MQRVRIAGPVFTCTLCLVMVFSMGGQSAGAGARRSGIFIEEFKNVKAPAEVGMLASSLIAQEFFNSGRFVLYTGPFHADLRLSGAITLEDKHYIAVVTAARNPGGEVIMMMRERINSGSDLADFAGRTVRNLDERVQGRLVPSGRFSIDAALITGGGMGTLFAKINEGFGVRMGFNFSMAGIRSLITSFAVTCIGYKPVEGVTEYYFSFPVSAGIGYRFFPLGNFSIAPLVSLGYLVSLVSHDPVVNRFGGPVYEQNVFHNFFLAFELQFSVAVSSRFEVVIEPSYRVFFEPNGQGHLLDVAAGVRFNL